MWKKRNLSLLLVPLLLGASPREAVVEWTYSYEAEDGTPIDAGDLVFLVYQDGTKVGETYDLSFRVAHVRCAEYAVVAKQLSTGLVSPMSDPVRDCAGGTPRPKRVEGVGVRYSR